MLNFRLGRREPSEISGGRLLALCDWLHSLFAYESLINISGYIEVLGDKIHFYDVEKNKSYPLHDWEDLVAGCEILSWMISKGPRHYHALSFREYCTDKKERITC